ncbi:DUF1835 domain-containing protein [Planococcus sp. 4-30]|uniref:DUF1835 domain-containing protein n=1 Tax=Planococcus sp. 4-30 TaxID=2874583 RepID=UPI001CC034C8|nr:DUF1835 domain-containing protein [Planococcus sp. 4-30]
MIHIVNGESAAAALKNTLSETTDQIIPLPMDFSVGPITAIHLENGVSIRADWEGSSYHPLNNRSDEALSIFQRSLKELKDVKNGEQLVIWTCENASEQIGLRIACFLLTGKHVGLFVVNTLQALNEYLKDQEIQQTVRHSGECNAKQLAHFFNYSSLSVTKDMRIAFEEDGKNLLHSTSQVLTWKNGEILEEAETRDDSFIIDCIKKQVAESAGNDYVDAIRVIGEAYGLSEQPISDSWIDYRIRSLIEDGQVAFIGGLQSMRSYKIKAVD